MGSNPASPTPRFESEGPSAFRFRATGSVYSRRLRRRVAFSPAFSPLVLRCAPSAPVELAARPLRLARARYGASALRAESSNPAFSPLVLRRAPSAPVELVARTRVLRFQVSQINCDSKRVIAHPAFSPIAFGCKQACAARLGSPAFSGAHRVRPSNFWLARLGSPARASFSSESNQLRQQTCHRTSRPSASPTCCVLATRSPVRTECARRTRGSPALARPLWLARVPLEFQSFPSIVSA